MKTGMKPSELQVAVLDGVKYNNDYIVDTRSILVDSNGHGMQFTFDNDEKNTYTLNNVAHNQVCGFTGIPRNYYNQMKNENANSLLVENVKYWLNKKPAKRLLRTQKNIARAFLSDRYKIIDNVTMLNAIMPVLSEYENYKIESSNLDDEKIHLKIIFPKIQEEISVGDIVQSGVCISNSEVGCGAFRVEPLIYRLICKNGAILKDHQTRKFHIGRKTEYEEDYSVYSEETREQDSKVFAMKAKDLVKASMNEIFFKEQVSKMRNLKNIKLRNPINAIQEVFSSTLSESEADLLLNNLFNQCDNTAYGLMNTITSMAQDDSLSYKRSTELERIGGSLLEIDAERWNKISQN